MINKASTYYANKHSGMSIKVIKSIDEILNLYITTTNYIFPDKLTNFLSILTINFRDNSQDVMKILSVVLVRDRGGGISIFLFQEGRKLKFLG